ncbi:MAG TPA: CAP domain-containing protein [Lunatimonas sp.]|nr:CAP domain-containing protein [Lunatimonas sp.]
MIANLLYLLFFLGSVFQPISSSTPPTALSPDEQELFDLINTYRKSRGLSAVLFSSALTQVAQVHAKDLMENYTQGGRCNMHSWSNKGPWKSCCYRDNHKNPECMWDKPMEIAGYDSPGYEIAYWHSAAAQPGIALEVWKKSPGHHAVIANLGVFKDAEWKAMGVGIYQGYAVVWFGEMEG